MLNFNGVALTVPGILVTLIGLIVLWIVVSIPVWLAGKAATASKETFGDALLATLAGPIVYFLVLFLVGFFLGSVIGSGAFVFGYILALIAWMRVFKASFQTGWLQAILIAFLAWVFYINPERNSWLPIPDILSTPFFPEI